jgi:VCBS repeat-containing protein
MTHDIGDLVTLRVAFVDSAGEPVDPTTVTLTVQDPDGGQTSPSTSSSETGVYTGTVTPDASGVWRYRFTGTGAHVAVEEGSFEVAASRIGVAVEGTTEVVIRGRVRRLTAADYDP